MGERVFYNVTSTMQLPLKREGQKLKETMGRRKRKPGANVTRYTQRKETAGAKTRSLAASGTYGHRTLEATKRAAKFPSRNMTGVPEFLPPVTRDSTGEIPLPARSSSSHSGPPTPGQLRSVTEFITGRRRY